MIEEFEEYLPSFKDCFFRDEWNSTKNLITNKKNVFKKGLKPFFEDLRISNLSPW